MEKIISDLLANPEGVVALVAGSGIGLYLIMEGFKWLSAKIVKREPENLLAFTITFLFANLGQYSAAAIGLIPMLHGTPFAAYSSLLMAAAMAVHQFTKTAMFDNLKHIWSDTKTGRQTRLQPVAGSDIGPVPALPNAATANATVPQTPPQPWS